jgi:hypothetical protein
MRSYVFTEIERKLIDTYLTKGIKEQDFYVLLNRIKSNHSRLRRDMELLEKIMDNISVQ